MISGNKYTALPVPESVISRVYQLARKKRSINTIEFMDRDMNPIDEAPQQAVVARSDSGSSTCDSDCDPDVEEDTDLLSDESISVSPDKDNTQPQDQEEEFEPMPPREGAQDAARSSRNEDLSVDDSLGDYQSDSVEIALDPEDKESSHTPYSLENEVGRKVKVFVEGNAVEPEELSDSGKSRTDYAKERLRMRSKKVSYSAAILLEAKNDQQREVSTGGDGKLHTM